MGGFRYGATTSCKDALGIIDLTFKHETTPESKEALKSKYYYQSCMSEARNSEWKNRKGLPMTPSCFKSVTDSVLARKYAIDVKFKSIAPEVKSILEKSESVLKSAVLPYWDIDPQSLDRSISQNPILKLDILFKENDKMVDVKLKTNKGISNFKDMPVNFDIFNGGLTNLRTDSLGTLLVSNNLAGVCLVTSASISTLDNATLSYNPENCWTLVSSHCSPKPTYAVFSKKDRNLPLAMKAYMGGHKVEFKPLNSKAMKITVNNAVLEINQGDQKIHKEGKSEIFRITNYGGNYVITNDLTVAIIYDGNFIQVIPLAVVNGQHCGICGNFDGSKFNELQDKNGNDVPHEQFARAWCK